jgi:excisionase family DNA binding protein
MGEKTMAENGKYLTCKEAADFTGIQAGTLYQMVHQNRIPHVRFGPRFFRFEKEELLTWMKQHRVGTAGKAVTEDKPLVKKDSSAEVQEQKMLVLRKHRQLVAFAEARIDDMGEQEALYRHAKESNAEREKHWREKKKKKEGEWLLLQEELEILEKELTT